MLPGATVKSKLAALTTRLVKTNGPSSLSLNGSGWFRSEPVT
jgi:hypothetical protein